MAKFQSPLLGYNNNVRYRGRIFHIQTEDSGVNHPHIITHLFMDGGRILKSFKRSYAEHVGSDKMSETVRLLMKEQHKAMFIALREGQFDHLLEEAKSSPGATPASPTSPKKAETKTDEAARAKAATATGAEAPKKEAPDAAAQKAEAPKTEAPKTEAPKTEAPKTEARKVEPPHAEARPPQAEARAKDAPATAARPASFDDGAAAMEPPRPDPDRIPSFIEQLGAETPPEAPTAIDIPRPTDSDESVPVVELGPIDSEAEAEVQAAAAEAAPSTTRDVEKRTISVADLTLDFDALERDTVDSSPQLPDNDLPPPPPNLFAKEPRTAPYSTIEPRTHHDWVQPSPRPATPGQAISASPVRPPAAPDAANDGRYAPARPAAIFGPPSSPTSKPTSPSLFDDDLISDKSLDEVILSYLAEDLDPPRRD